MTFSGVGFESLNLTLSNPVGTALGATNTATLGIADNDFSPPASNPVDDAGLCPTALSGLPKTANLTRRVWLSGRDRLLLCGSDNTCKELRRINVSAAFFLSIEFQQTGYLVERLYKSSYGDATGTPPLTEFIPLPVPIVRYGEFMADSPGDRPRRSDWTAGSRPVAGKQQSGVH